MTRTWFTSDLHLGHERVSEIRSFASVEEHDAAIRDGWLSCVRPGDVVWVLGDVTLGDVCLDLVKLKLLPGTKHLIVGNHDACHPMHRRAAAWQKIYLHDGAFESVQAFARRRLVGRDVLLSHFPYVADRPEYETARYLQYRLPDMGLPLLHGHTHSRVRLAPNGRELHVGVDAWNMKPVPMEAVIDLLFGQEGS